MTCKSSFKSGSEGHDLRVRDTRVFSLIRQIEEDDLPQVVTFLNEIFPERSRAYWEKGLGKIGALPSLPGRPRYGYVLDDNGIRGVVLAISSRHGDESDEMIITNLGSWCVAPSHRGRAAWKLCLHSTSEDSVTHTSLSSLPHVFSMIRRVGFKDWTAGQIAGIGRCTAPDFSGIISVEDASLEEISPRELAVLRDHQEFGCIAFCVRIKDRLAPMIFLPRKVKRIIPCAQLIYCKHLPDFLANSRAINLHLARRGYPLMIFDANGPAKEVLGQYYPGKAPKFFKGAKPRCDVDHTYSELVYLRV